MDRIVDRDGCPYLCIEMVRSHCNELRWAGQGWILRMTQCEFICALNDTVHLWSNQINPNDRGTVLTGMKAAQFNPHAFWNRLNPCIPIPLANDDSAIVDLRWYGNAVQIRISEFAVLAASYITAKPTLPVQALQGSATLMSIWSKVIEELERSAESD